MSEFKGQSSPVSVKKIIKELFRNLKTENTKIYFSLLELSDEQKSSIILPAGFSPLDINILVQINDLPPTLFFIALMTKEDGYIYGYSFNIIDQPAFTKKQLTKCKDPVALLPSVTFSNRGVLESYIKVNRKAYNLSLSNYPNINSSNLIFSGHDKIINNTLTQEGLLPGPVIKQKRISKNLKKLI
ncbi:hypothetical protein Catovirus_1_401 [Catovirus CTV1]|uniref:Uncharacterized protein n=1 Tax=Catovirus CTV1 TaxID=1977631 RepID=A0A1V0S9H7_9VIRU|nr:hypothetical protein Catovirus_1_401 [Catovirus CTV1]